MPSLLFVPTPLVLPYYIGLALRGSVDDQTSIWTMVLTEYVFMAGAMFVSNAREGTSPSYYTYNPRSNHIGNSLLFLLLPNILDTLKYFGLNNFARCMGTNPV